MTPFAGPRSQDSDMASSAGIIPVLSLLPPNKSGIGSCSDERKEFLNDCRRIGCHEVLVREAGCSFKVRSLDNCGFYPQDYMACGERVTFVVPERPGLVASFVTYMGNGPRPRGYVCIDRRPGIPGWAMAAAMDRALAEYRIDTPNMTISAADSLERANGARVPVVLLHYGKDCAESVAFIGEPKVTVRIGVRGLEKDLSEELGLLGALVRSYARLGAE